MHLYLFWSIGDPGVFALTIDPEGETLPAELGPWEPNEGGGPLIDLLDGWTSTIKSRVLVDGFHLVRSERVAAVIRASAANDPGTAASAVDLEEMAALDVCIPRSAGEAEDLQKDLGGGAWPRAALPSEPQAARVDFALAGRWSFPTTYVPRAMTASLQRPADTSLVRTSARDWPRRRR